MLKTTTDKKFLKEHLAESIMATIVALIMVGLPVILVFFKPDRAAKWVEDMGLLIVLCLALFVFRTPDIFTAIKRLKELKALEEQEDNEES